MYKKEILTLPKIVFAHSFKAERYSASFEINKNNNFIEIAYIREGSQTIQTNGKIDTAFAGDIICSFRDRQSSVTSDSYHSHHTIGIEVVTKNSDSPNALHIPEITRSSPETEEIKKRIDSLIYEPYLYENSNAKTASEILNILCKINAIYLKNLKNENSNTNILAYRAKKFIHQNLQNNLTLTAIAHHLGITPQYLCQVFKNEEGISVIKYINKTKLQKIQVLIEKENMKLYEASQLFGYNDPNYVSHLYKKMFGRNITEISKKTISQF